MSEHDPASASVPFPPDRTRSARPDAGIWPAEMWRMLRRFVDALPEEGILCSALGRVIHANAAARRWLASARDATPLRDAVAAACAMLRHAMPEPVVRGDEPASHEARGLVTLGGTEMELRAIDLGVSPDGVVPSVLVLVRAEWPAQPGGIGSLSARLSRRLGLTPSEREIARLLAMRCTDGEIASALGISVRTVQSHVQHIFGKLGVHSRRAVGTALAALHDALPPVAGSGATRG